jgi:hypothetical protein
MKKTIVTAMSVITLSMMATEPGKGTEHPEKYCAKMKGGKKEIMHNGMAITKEATLANGVKIKPDGTIVKKDGSTEMLNEGECMDKEGMVMNEKNKDHEKKNGKSESSKY